MNNRIKRIAASVLAVSIGVSIFAGCSHATSSGKQEVITDDSVWYDVTRIDVDDGVDESQFVYRIKQFGGVVNDRVVYRITSCLEPTETNSEYESIEELEAFDLQGNLTASVSLKEAFLDLNLGSTIYIDKVKREGAVIAAYATIYDNDYNTAGNFRAEWDGSSGSIGEVAECTNTEFADVLGYNTPLRSFDAEGYTIECYLLWNEQYEGYLVVSDESGNRTLIDIREELPTVNPDDIYDMPAVIPHGEGKALICFDVMGGPVYCDLDLNTYDIFVSSVDYSWLNTSIGDIRNVSGIGSVVLNGDGIFNVNLDEGTFDPVFSYSNTNINRYVADDLYPIAIDDDRVVMTGTVCAPAVMGTIGPDDVVIYVFEKADSNPNAGKQIIRVASIGGYSYALCDAVCRFNDESEEYFAEFDRRYELGEFLESNTAYYDADSLMSLTENVCADLGNQLSVDLLSGDGPDIIIGGAAYSQINKPDYLVDLTEYASENLPSSAYYTNVIDAAGRDGVLYQLPVSFRIAGIVAPSNASAVEPGQNGFTFEQYRNFVSTDCNGMDPLNYGKTGFFVSVMNSMMDIMTDETGKVSFDNEAFRSLAEYTEDNVFDPMESDGEDYYIYVDETAASEMIIGGLFTYHRMILDKNMVMMGYPSYDGRGPRIIGRSSIGVSAQSDCIDGCMEFVTNIMGYESQRNFGCEYGLPVNREAFADLAEDYVEGFNASIDRNLKIYSAEELNAMGDPSEHIDESVVNDFENLTDSLSGTIYNVDAPVDAIILEEIPGYFEGQKTLDEVISVIEDRTSNVVNERF